jgi:hypothetical protein
VRRGDARLRQRLVELASTFADNPKESIPGAYGGDWSAPKAAYRCVDNAQVEFSAIPDGHGRATLRRVAGRDFILIAQATSTEVISTAARSSPFPPRAHWLMQHSAPVGVCCGCA